MLENELNDALNSFGAVYINGPKFSGKTWLGLSVANSAYIIGDIDSLGNSNLEYARMNPRAVLNGDAPHLIDEWQEIPQIWDAVRSDIDRKGGKGLYVLTGSSTPKQVKPVHSGAGRIYTLHLRTMSLFESGDSTGEVSLRALFSGSDINTERVKVSLESLADLVMSGGWPAGIGLSQKGREMQVRGYLDTVLEDACHIDGVHRSRKGMEAVLRSLARNETTMASLARIHRDTGLPLDQGPLISENEIDGDRDPVVSYNTVLGCLDALDRLNLICNQDGFDPNPRSSARVTMSPKRHLVDPSLSAAILGLSSERLISDLRTFGFLFEALCERDLQIYSQAIGGRLMHYRDDVGREIDAVVELRDGRWGAFEIKLGWNQVEAAAENLKKVCGWLSSKGSVPPSFMCVLCGLSETAYRRPDGVYVAPITAMRD